MPLSRYRSLLESSPFLEGCRQLKAAKGASRLFGDAVRGLTPHEIKALESQGNRAEEWALVKVAADFSTLYVHGCMFVGSAVLGLFDGRKVNVDGMLALPNGLYASTIVNSEIGSNALVNGVGVVSNMVLKEGALLFQTKQVSAGTQNSFGNGCTICVGPETGGREVLSVAELPAALAAEIALNRSDADLQAAYESFAKTYTAAAALSYGVVESGAIIRNSVTVADSYVGSGVTVDGAQLVQNATLLGSAKEPTIIGHGAVVADSCVQWGSVVTTFAYVKDSIIIEYSHVEKQGKVSQSIIGPSAGVAEGEVTSCLLGPLVGFHHQSLLIAALWPQGRGNVAQGANVGSNHTSRLPDQELICGEGLFFGLGVNIKFPADYSHAPYTVIATGVDTAPQKVSFPFSLITVASGPAPLGCNELVPGWMLTDNLYAVLRAEYKFRRRDHASRNRTDLAVFRPEIMDMIEVGRNRLGGLTSDQAWFAPDEVEGAGANILSQRSIQRAMAVYTLFIEYYVLQRLTLRIESLLKSGQGVDLAGLLADADQDPSWSHASKLFVSEAFSKRSIVENLKRLIEINQRILTDVVTSKTKDDVRGKTIISDYETCHVPAAKDPFIRELTLETDNRNRHIDSLIKRLG